MTCRIQTQPVLLFAAVVYALIHYLKFRPPMKSLTASIVTALVNIAAMPASVPAVSDGLPILMIRRAIPIAA